MLALFLGALAAGWFSADEASRPWWDDTAETGAALVAAALALRAARHRTSGHQVWRWAALAALCWGAGQAVLTYMTLVRHDSSRPGPGDAFFVLAAICAVAAPCSVPSSPDRASGGAVTSMVRIVLDGALVAISALFVVWELVFTPVLHAHRAASSALAVGYPLVDVLVLTVVASAAMRADVLHRRSWGPAALGLLTLSLTNVHIFYLGQLGHLRSGDPVDAGFVLAFALIGLGAVRHTGRDRAAAQAKHPGLHALLPYALAPLDIVLVIARRGQVGTGPAAVLATGVVILFARQVLMAAENADLGRELTRRSRRFEALVAGSSDLTFLLSGPRRISYASPSVAGVLAQPCEALLGRDLLELVTESDRADLRRVLDDVARRGGHGEAVVRVAAVGGAVRWLAATVGRLPEGAGTAGFVVNARDCTQTLLDRSAMAESEERYRRIVENATEGIWLCDQSSTTRFVNGRAAEMLGIDADSAVGRPVLECLSPLLSESDLAALAVRLQERRSGESDSYEVSLRRPDGKHVHTWISAVPLLGADGQPDGSLTMITDITRRKELERQLEQQARTDSVTELGNRHLLRQRAAELMGAGSESERVAGLVYLDLDGFKEVNDTLGHHTGDALLRAVAGRFATVVGGGGLLVRLGGDEFAVLVPGASAAPGVDARELARRMLEALDRPIVLAGQELQASASAGVAWAADGEDIDDLLRNADLAMYRAKAAGRGRVHVFAAEMHSEALARMQVAGELRQALDRHELVAAYQPILRSSDGALVGAEALVRWHHPVRGLLAAGEFIDVAESCGLVAELSDQLMVEALSELARWHRLLSPALTMSVNVAAAQLQDGAFTARVRGAAADAGVSMDSLVVELTERSLLAGTQVVTTVRELHAAGARIALDDFGTGFSSLTHLRDLPVGILKLDRSFVSSLSTERSRPTRLAAGVLTLAHTLGVICTAEGVETVRQRQALESLGCDQLQGYLLGRPMLAEAFRAWASARMRGHTAVPEQRSSRVLNS